MSKEEKIFLDTRLSEYQQRGDVVDIFLKKGYFKDKKFLRGKVIEVNKRTFTFLDEQGTSKTYPIRKISLIFPCIY